MLVVTLFFLIFFLFLFLIAVCGSKHRFVDAAWWCAPANKTFSVPADLYRSMMILMIQPLGAAFAPLAGWAATIITGTQKALRYRNAPAVRHAHGDVLDLKLHSGPPTARLYDFATILCKLRVRSGPASGQGTRPPMLLA